MNTVDIDEAFARYAAEDSELAADMAAIDARREVETDLIAAIVAPVRRAKPRNIMHAHWLAYLGLITSGQERRDFAGCTLRRVDGRTGEDPSAVVADLVRKFHRVGLMGASMDAMARLIARATA